jgi:hypothetical protein
MGFNSAFKGLILYYLEHRYGALKKCKPTDDIKSSAGVNNAER